MGFELYLDSDTKTHTPRHPNVYPGVSKAPIFFFETNTSLTDLKRFHKNVIIQKNPRYTPKDALSLYTRHRWIRIVFSILTQAASRQIDIKVYD